MKRVLALLLLLSAVFAVAQPGDWVLETTPMPGGEDKSVATLSYDDGVQLKIDNTASDKSKMTWKLYKTAPRPFPGADFQFTFEVKINAPDVNLDNNAKWGGGEGDYNDGPFIMAFLYADNESDANDPPFSKNSFTFGTGYCHVHMECNWVGDTELGYGFFCASQATYPGWSFDGSTFGDIGAHTNQFTEEPFIQDAWKKITNTIDSNECSKDNVTLVVMGSDVFTDKHYDWEIRDVKLGNEQVPLDFIWDVDSGDYLTRPAYCGDGEKNGNEECDGSDGVEYGWSCTSACKLQSVCGDTKIVGDEVCDSTNTPKGYSCASDCKSMSSVCGDDWVTVDELCDGDNVTFGFKCGSNCQSMTSVCGDGFVVGDEECDLTNGTSANYKCAPDCSLYRVLNTGEMVLMDSITTLMMDTQEGKPALSEISLVGPGRINVTDIEEQLALGNKTLPANRSIVMCVQNDFDCEEKYLFGNGFSPTANQFTIPDGERTGLLKVYKIVSNGTTEYHVGFRESAGGLLPYLDWTIWVILAAVVILILILAMILMLAFAVYMYFKSKQKQRL
ncbi:MAG: hypothetical protein JW834_03990 [Candidatus Diapherotrites archaeon]|nr:hypothetical protein [Candidatus Diapherotrites archaeon]